MVVTPLGHHPGSGVSQCQTVDTRVDTARSAQRQGPNKTYPFFWVRICRWRAEATCQNLTSERRGNLSSSARQNLCAIRQLYVWRLIRSPRGNRQAQAMTICRRASCSEAARTFGHQASRGNKGRSRPARDTRWHQAPGRPMRYRKGGGVLSRIASFGLVSPRFNYLSRIHRGIQGEIARNKKARTRRAS